MSSNWRRVSIGELISEGIIIIHKDGNHGSNYPRSSDFNETDGVKFLTAKNLDDSGNVDLEAAPLLSHEKSRNISFGYVATDDVLLSHNATVGRVAVVPPFADPIIIGTSLTQYRVNKESLLPSYLAAFFNSRDFQNQLAAVMSQTTRNQVPITSQRKLFITVPPIEDQTSICNHVDAINSKISITNSINQTLEEMAQAIFKSWFVDFDPVKAKTQVIAQGGSEQDANLAAMQIISGKTRDQLAALELTHPEQYTQLHTTASLFPSAFVDSELGEIPEGWEAGTVGDIAEAKGGYAFKSSHFQSTGNPVIKIKNITGNGDVDIENTECVSDEVANSAEKFLLFDGDLVMAMTGATIGKTGLIQTNGKRALLNQRVAKFFSSEHGNRISWFLFCLFKLESAAEFIISTAQGSAQPNISSTGIESTPAVIPPHSLIKAFIERVNPFFEIWLHNQIQIKTLSTTRDILLPKLLSGEIDVSQLNLND